MTKYSVSSDRPAGRPAPIVGQKHTEFPAARPCPGDQMSLLVTSVASATVIARRALEPAGSHALDVPAMEALQSCTARTVVPAGTSKVTAAAMSLDPAAAAFQVIAFRAYAGAPPVTSVPAEPRVVCRPRNSAVPGAPATAESSIAFLQTSVRIADTVAPGYLLGLLLLISGRGGGVHSGGADSLAIHVDDTPPRTGSWRADLRRVIFLCQFRPDHPHLTAWIAGRVDVVHEHHTASPDQRPVHGQIREGPVDRVVTVDDQHIDRPPIQQPGELVLGFL